MTVRKKEYHRPESWIKAHQLLNRPDVRSAPLLIGPRPAAPADLDVDALIDLQKLQLDLIQKGQDNRIHLGALTTLQALYESELLKAEAGGILNEAARISATLGIRNLANIAGVIVHPDGPQDVILVLMALDAMVVIQQGEGQTRHVPLHEWIAAEKTAQKRSDIIIEVNFPSRPEAMGSLARVGRTPRDLAIVAAAAVMEVRDGVIRRTGLAVAGATPIPARLLKVEELLTGKPVSTAWLDEAAGMVEKQADPQGDYRGSVEYRRAMAGVLCRRALAAACQPAEEA